MLVFDQLKRNDRSLWVMALGVLAGLGLLLGGLWYHQIVTSHQYVRRQKNQSIRTVRVPALRGKILDRNGEILAENRPSYNLNLYVEELSDQFKEAFQKGKGARKLSYLEMIELGRRTRYCVASNAVRQLAVLLRQPLWLEEGTFNRHYTNRLVLPLPVMDDVTPQVMARFLECPNKPPGFNLEVQSLRFYPHGATAGHLLGHLQRIDDFSGTTEMETFYCLPDYEGKVGLEGAFDEDLRGQAGIKSIMVNSVGYRQSENIWTPTEPGQNLVLTIDLRIQRAAEQALRGVSSLTKGAVVVMDTQNGDILALVSSPIFDPNQFIPRMRNDMWEKLSDPEANPMLNRATYGSYPPGSIFKIIVALAGLEAGDLDPHEIYASKGYFQIGRSRKPIRDTAPAGDYDFRRAFKLSSNSYFIYHGLRTGLTNIMNMGQRFFLGQRTGVPLRQEVSGFFPSPEWLTRRNEQRENLHPGDVANLCIGQGYLTVTPLQMAIMTAAIANGGKVFWPRLARCLESPEANRGLSTKTFPGGRIRGQLELRPQTLEIIREAMLADVEDQGTGRGAVIEGWRICGKTGTATHDRDARKDTWFVSYAPYEAPRYAVVVLVEGGGSGGATCAPVARQVYQAIRRVEAADATLRVAAREELRNE